MKTFTLTFIALIAFAANSILCRIALGQQYIDPAGFTIIRLLSGSIALYVILNVGFYRRKASNGDLHNNKLQTSRVAKGSWLGSVLLFIYALSFSYAYGYLDTGTGALILFGSVQIAMILFALATKSKLLIIQWLGLGIACTGFVYLIYPDLTSPSLTGFILMMISGVAWAGYTIVGKKSDAPLVDTCYNFFRATPFVLLLTVLTLSTTAYSYYGILLAVISGAVMSGIGYAIWYSALKGLSTIKAGVLQLLVPVIASLGGIIFINEIMTTRLLISTIIVLLGIALVLLGKQLKANNHELHKCKAPSTN